MNRVRSTITRVIRPAATRPWPSLTETRNVEPATLDGLQGRLGADVTTHRGGREVVELHPVADAGRALGELAVDGADGRLFRQRTTRGVASTGTSPVLSASAVSSSVTTSSTAADRPGRKGIGLR